MTNTRELCGGELGPGEYSYANISNEAIFARFGHADAGMVEAIRDEAVKREREACAKVAEAAIRRSVDECDTSQDIAEEGGYNSACSIIAAAIRARKN